MTSQPKLKPMPALVPLHRNTGHISDLTANLGLVLVPVREYTEADGVHPSIFQRNQAIESSGQPSAC